MNSRKRVIKTLTFDKPDRIPRQLWALPWAEENHPRVLFNLQKNYPDDLVAAPAIYKEPLRTIGDRYKSGVYIDEWGCKFENLHDGVIGIVHESRLKNWQQLEDFHPPEAVLSLDRDAVNSFCRESEKFVLAGTYTRPFERFQFIRTMEQGFIDLIERPPELFELLNRIHVHYLKEIEMWSQTEVDGISLMDDWGSQQDLLVSPNIFRDLFKPMYREYGEIAQHYGKFVFMHSDGYITDIICDLIEVGVDALNSQIFCMGLKDLGERFRGNLTFWGEIDRQQLLPRGSRQDIEQAVRDVYEHLYTDGGVIAQCEFGPGAKPENVTAVFETWNSF